jgi:signal transduction histidine kinase
MVAPDTTKAALAPISRRLRILGLAVVFIAACSEIALVFARLDEGGAWVWYVGVGAAYLGLYTYAVLWPPRTRPALHAILASECAVVVFLLSRHSDYDFLIALLVPLAFLAALFFEGRTIWVWVAVLATLTAVSLMVYMGPLRGLALALTSMAMQVVFAAFVVVAREVEAARAESQTMLHELEATHRRLKDYSAKAAELAILEQRDRVAQDLNDSVAETVAGIITATRSARSLLAAPAVGVPADAREAPTTADPEAVVASLQTQTQWALAQMRGLIAELRPKSE